MAEKILLIINASVKETAGYLYPYKGVGREFRKYRGILSKTICDLREHGYIEEVEIKGEKYLKITIKGRLKALKKAVYQKWDGWWRIISFDIEEKRKLTRNAFRLHLNSLGCKPIQKSVWITPNDISCELDEIVAILNIENNTDYFLAKAITHEEKYLKLFDLDNVKNSNK